ncbi:hypothetical protein GCM10009554_16970 [Kribbella koreensis]|uniref:MarR family transcriptional regulator n=1 Tax=Kribbella koreensis TaxID=57909 RepID=A0ABN1PU98_9ACTN
MRSERASTWSTGPSSEGITVLIGVLKSTGYRAHNSAHMITFVIIVTARSLCVSGASPGPGRRGSPDRRSVRGVAGEQPGLGQLVKHLEREGYVELAADPDDRRAKLIRRTGAGDAVVGQVSALLDGVEQAWRAEVGAERFDVFREVLSELAAKLR